MKYCLYFLFVFTLFSGFFVKNSFAADDSIKSVDSIKVNDLLVKKSKTSLDIPFVISNLTYMFGTPVNSSAMNIIVSGFGVYANDNAYLRDITHELNSDGVSGSAKILTTFIEQGSTVLDEQDSADISEITVDGNATIQVIGNSAGMSISKLNLNVTFSGLEPNKRYCPTLIIHGTDGSVMSGSDCFYTLTTDGTDPTPTTTTTQGGDNKTYQLIEPLPIGPNGALQPTVDVTNIGDYINLMIKLMFALAGAAAVVVIIKNGFTMMTSNSPFSLGEAKKAFWDVILGLLLMLSAYGILNTINPNLVNLHVGLPQANGVVGDTSSATPGVANPGTDPSTGKSLAGNFVPTGALSSGSVLAIANSYVGKASYYWGGQGAEGVSGTVAFDCGGFANRIRQAAGLTSFSTNDAFQSDQAAISAGAVPVTLSVSSGNVVVTDTNTSKPITLKPGDILGWPNPDGHIIIYAGTDTNGNGQITQCQGPGVYDNSNNLVPANEGKCVSVSSFASSGYLSRIKYVISK